MTQEIYKTYDEKIDALLSKMTLREKIGQLNQIVIPVSPEALERAKELMKKGEVGSFILAGSPTAGNEEQRPTNVKYINSLQKFAVEEGPNGIPLIFGRDVIHGHHTVYPIPLASACAFNPGLLEKCYRAIAEEASACGVNWTFSPMLDICHDPRWGRIVEGPGEDPFVGAAFARAAVRGFQNGDISKENTLAACAKHFLGYGYSEGGRDYNRTEISDYTLYNNVIPPFRAAVDEGVATVMASFNDINGEPVMGSEHYLTKMLRDDLGFNGYVISDWEAILQIKDQGVAENREECATLALKAGTDMDMVDNIYIDCLENLVSRGEIDEKYIDMAVRRVLRIKMAKGLFEHPYTTREMPDRREHISLSREIAGESMILLKNKDNLLPLKKNANIVLSGPFKDDYRVYHGTWTLDGRPDETATLTEALREVLSANGGQMKVSDNDPMFDDSPHAFFFKRDAVVLALGESRRVTGEAKTRTDIDISEGQIKLAKQAYESGNKVVGVIFGGRPLCLSKIEPYLDAIVYAWHCGTETAHAVCDILFGDINPSGKASVTFVRSSGHIPLYYNSTTPARDINSYYGNFLSYMYIDDPAVPLYPFGYGLSYSNFEISNIRVREDKISYADIMSGKKFEISLDVKNIGKYDGKETVQLYIRDISASLTRHARELKAFDKSFYKSGETKTVKFNLGEKDLGFYFPDGKYTLEKGKFEIFIGNSSLAKNKIEIAVV